MKFSRLLANAFGIRAVQAAPVVGVLLDVTGTVDVGPERVVVSGPEAFPPTTAWEGAVGDADLELPRGAGHSPSGQSGTYGQWRQPRPQQVSRSARVRAVSTR